MYFQVLELNNVVRRMIKNVFMAGMAAFITTGIYGCGGNNDSAAGVVPIILIGTTYKVCDSNTEITYEFKQVNTGTKTIQSFSNVTCSTGAGAAISTDFTYSLGNVITANDGLTATKMDIVETSTTLFTLIRLSGGLVGTGNLNFGSTINSSAGLDGTTDAKRHDGLDLSVTYELQP